MKSFFSVRLFHLLACVALLAPVFAFAQGNTVTIDLTAGSLYNSTGTLLPTNNLVLLIAAENGDTGFDPLVTGSNLSIDSFLNGNDQIVGVTSISNDGTGTAMTSLPSITVGSSPFTNLAVGDPLAVVWFSGLTSSSTVLTSGSYGLFTGTTADSNTNSPWSIPSTTSTIDLNFQTENDLGSHPETDGYANLMAVPEPSTYALICGIAALLAAFWRRSQGVADSAAGRQPDEFGG